MRSLYESLLDDDDQVLMRSEYLTRCKEIADALRKAGLELSRDSTINVAKDDILIKTLKNTENIQDRDKLVQKKMNQIIKQLKTLDFIDNVKLEKKYRPSSSITLTKYNYVIDFKMCTLKNEQERISKDIIYKIKANNRSGGIYFNNYYFQGDFSVILPSCDPQKSVTDKTDYGYQVDLSKL